MTITLRRGDKHRGFIFGVTYARASLIACDFRHALGIHLIFWSIYVKWNGFGAGYRVGNSGRPVEMVQYQNKEIFKNGRWEIYAERV